MNDKITNLINAYKLLPGIGQKNAERLAFYTLEMDLEQIEYISSSIVDTYKQIKKREELKVIRTRKLYENITINGNTFQVRKDDLENFWEVDYMVTNGEVTETDMRNWVLADNKIKTFTYSQILGVLTEFIKRKAEVFNKFTELSMQLEICKTTEEIERISWK